MTENFKHFKELPRYHIYLLKYFSSVAQLCLILWDPLDCSIAGFLVHHQLLEFTQTHVHWVGDAIQSSHPLLSPSPTAFSLSQHQGLFQWVGSLHQVATLRELQIHTTGDSDSVLLMSIQGWFSLELMGLISLLSKGLWRVFCNTTVQKHQFFSSQPSLWSNSHIYTWLLKKSQLWHGNTS